ncbi:CCAAT- binding transcription factor component [Spiromyces aspiralis]|uniref:CCAAT- binding transcription factor component n=1 Tax=Spiromyces aspiralis TaxID=68401 RepID=A0ACC1HIA8_9FUNG|nr:CCAAT- binding transcription factor component [Spiromyces aspiralis]
MSNLNQNIYAGAPDPSGYGFGASGGDGGAGAYGGADLTGGTMQLGGHPGIPSSTSHPRQQQQIGIQGDSGGSRGQGPPGNQPMNKQARAIQDFWKQQLDEIHNGPHDFKHHQLPLARIKKVMKTDEDVKMISAEAPIVFSKACEIMILELTLRAWMHAEESKRRTLQRSDISHAVSKSDMFDFLIDIVPREDTIVKSAAPNPVMGVDRTGLEYYQGVAAGMPRMLGGTGQYIFQNPGGSAMPLMDQFSQGFLRSSLPGMRKPSSQQTMGAPPPYTLGGGGQQDIGGGAGIQQGYYQQVTGPATQGTSQIPTGSYPNLPPGGGGGGDGGSSGATSAYSYGK